MLMVSRLGWRTVGAHEPQAISFNKVVYWIIEEGLWASSLNSPSLLSPLLYLSVLFYRRGREEEDAKNRSTVKEYPRIFLLPLVISPDFIRPKASALTPLPSLYPIHNFPFIGFIVTVLIFTRKLDEIISLYYLNRKLFL